MAEKKFSQLTAKAATIADTDLVAISESAGGGTYVSKSVTGANIKALVTDANLVTSDITTNNVSTAKHGFVPKAPNDATQFLDGTGAFDTVKDSDLSTSDITTNNVSTTKHGFAPKLPNDATKFLDGTGNYSTPASGGLTNFTEAANSSAPNATVPVDSLSASGAATNIDIAIVPKGTGAFMLDIPDNTAAGGNKRGARAIDLSLSRGAADRVASGADSINMGTDSTASGASSIALNGNGVGNNSVGIQGGTASGTRGVAIGNNAVASGSQALCVSTYTSATASGNYSVALMSATASGQFSMAVGEGATASGGNDFAHGYRTSTQSIRARQSRGHAYTSFGDCQKSEFYLSNRTTGNTATTLTVEGGAASATNQVILSNQSAYGFTGTIVGKQSGSTNAVMWKVEGLIARGANAASTVLTTSTVTLVSNAPAWGTPTLAADANNGGLRVQVTGAAATNIQWTAVIETTEVIYA